MKKNILASIISLPLILVATSSYAQSKDDTWEISGSYFKPDVSTTFSGRGTVSDGTETYSDSGSYRFDNDDFDGIQLEGIWRFSDRQRLVADWYGIEDDNRWSVNESGIYSDPDPDIGDIEYSANGEARLDTEFQLYSLKYGYDFIDNEDLTFTGLIGVYGAKIESNLNASGMAIVDGEEYTMDVSESIDETRHAPGLGISTEWQMADRWELRAGIEGFKTNWGNFDNDGHFYNANVQLGYEITPMWSAFAGYDWFDLKLKEDISESVVEDGTTYALNGEATGRLKIHGPVIGVRAHF